ncbi:hypothetical protein [Flavobacterium sp. W21_SRS_FM6]|uniref:hypothetical protein n=1 Tax=Flavobacterium sp. W21_SRS_FM6 TaxID=3240268 RepID=UPI003F8EFDAB
MDLSSIGNVPQLAIASAPLKPTPNEKPVAFGIGQDKTVELSAQGKILQQAEQAQNQRTQALQTNTEQNTPANTEQTNDFVRVSSSVGSAQKNNLSSEQATEVYRSIEKLL